MSGLLKGSTNTGSGLNGGGGGGGGTAWEGKGRKCPALEFLKETMQWDFHLRKVAE